MPQYLQAFDKEFLEGNGRNHRISTVCAAAAQLFVVFQKTQTPKSLGYWTNEGGLEKGVLVCEKPDQSSGEERDLRVCGKGRISLKRALPVYGKGRNSLRRDLQVYGKGLTCLRGDLQVYGKDRQRDGLVEGGSEKVALIVPLVLDMGLISFSGWSGPICVPSSEHLRPGLFFEQSKPQIFWFRFAVVDKGLLRNQLAFAVRSWKQKNWESPPYCCRSQKSLGLAQRYFVFAGKGYGSYVPRCRSKSVHLGRLVCCYYAHLAEPFLTFLVSLH